MQKNALLKNRIIWLLVGMLSLNGHVLGCGFRLLVSKNMDIFQNENAGFFPSLLLTEDTEIVELFVSHPHAEPAS